MHSCVVMSPQRCYRLVKLVLLSWALLDYLCTLQYWACCYTKENPMWVDGVVLLIIPLWLSWHSLCSEKSLDLVGILFLACWAFSRSISFWPVVMFSLYLSFDIWSLAIILDIMCTTHPTSTTPFHSHTSSHTQHQPRLYSFPTSHHQPRLHSLNIHQDPFHSHTLNINYSIPTFKSLKSPFHSHIHHDIPFPHIPFTKTPFHSHILNIHHDPIPFSLASRHFKFPQLLSIC